MNCHYCGEPCIVGKERLHPIGTPDGRGLAHAECLVRQVLGSVAHLERRCSCYVPGSTASDPEGMSLREAAQAAAAALQKTLDVAD